MKFKSCLLAVLFVSVFSVSSFAKEGAKESSKVAGKPKMATKTESVLYGFTKEDLTHLQTTIKIKFDESMKAKKLFNSQAELESTQKRVQKTLAGFAKAKLNRSIPKKLLSVSDAESLQKLLQASLDASSLDPRVNPKVLNDPKKRFMMNRMSPLAREEFEMERIMRDPRARMMKLAVEHQKLNKAWACSKDATGCTPNTLTQNEGCPQGYIRYDLSDASLCLKGGVQGVGVVASKTLK